ncbi:hypothetical protein MRB53_027952 [Persea americana]|uniref:Uncharacterized protein n=1 Tax=Persea americana TaxID=3435 RepID=A0ACC2KET4_PERAE|nr:hypothetical protein MRB53_027952 [Persea americana]
MLPLFLQEHKKGITQWWNSVFLLEQNLPCLAARYRKLKKMKNETDNVEGTSIFSSSWLPGRNSAKKAKWSKKQKQQHDVGPDEDVVENLVLSLDGGESMSDSPSIEDGGHEMTRSAPSKQGRNKRKLSTSSK